MKRVLRSGDSVKSGRLGELVYAAAIFVAVACSGFCGAQGIGSIEPVAPFSHDSTGLFLPDTLQTGLSSEVQFEAIGRRIAGAEQTPLYLSTTVASENTVLPAVPAAVSMAVCGFLCVSLVRDRRTWIAMLAGLLWLGQTGIQAVPQLTYRVCSRIGCCKSSCAAGGELAIVLSEDSTDNDHVIRFIGLLKKLEGIPDHRNDALSFSSHLRSKNVAGGLNGLYGRRTITHKDNLSWQAYVPSARQNDRIFVCPAGAVEHRIVFSPAFVFDNLARGPPAVFLI